MGLIMLFLPRQDQHGDAGAPAELRHGVGEAEHAGADHGSDIVEAGVPPLGVPRRVYREPVVDRLLPRPCCDSLCWVRSCEIKAGKLQRVGFLQSKF